MSAVHSKHDLAQNEVFANAIYYPESDGLPMAESDKHRDLILGLIDDLKNHFEAEPEIYVTGNILVYYTEGVVQDSVAPDVMIVKGAPKGERRSYFVWEEQPPTVIFEIASRSTWKIDRVDKRLLYEMLGVQEYFVFNPDFPKRNPALLAFRLSSKMVLEPIEIANGRVYSEQLGLEIIDTGNGTLRLFDPARNAFVQTRAELRQETVQLREETAELREEAAEYKERATQAEAEKEALARRIAELEAMLKRQ